MGPIVSVIERTEHLVGTVIRSMALFHREYHRCVIKPLPFKIPPIEFYMVWHQRYHSDPGHQWLREVMLMVQKQVLGSVEI